MGQVVMGFNPFKSIGKFISDAFDFVVDMFEDVKNNLLKIL